MNLSSCLQCIQSTALYPLGVPLHIAIKRPRALVISLYQASPCQSTSSAATDTTRALILTTLTNVHVRVTTAAPCPHILTTLMTTSQPAATTTARVWNPEVRDTVQGPALDMRRRLQNPVVVTASAIGSSFGFPILYSALGSVLDDYRLCWVSCARTV